MTHPISINEIVNRIRQADFFTFTKINHGFWETLNDWNHLSKTGISPEEFDHQKKKTALMTDSFSDELLELIAGLDPSDQSMLFAVSPYAYPRSKQIAGTPIHHREVLELIENHVPNGLQVHDGLLWRRALIDGSLKQLFDCIKSLPVLLVGPSPLKDLPQKFGFLDSHFLEIPIDSARKTRHDIEQRILEHCQNSDKPRIILIQAGSLATWLALRLHHKLNKCWILDMGRSLDIVNPDYFFKQNWAHVFLKQLHQHWLDRDAPSPLSNEVNVSSTVSFLEDKTPNFEMLNRLWHLPSKNNQWTNYGPLVQKLENHIAKLLGLPDHREVVMCNNGTTAMLTAIGCHHFTAGKHLRWVTAANSFFTTTINLLHDAKVIDTDRQGMLSLELLERLPIDSFDGVIVTNLFGAAESLAPYKDFCDQHNKLLFIDNAYGFDYKKRLHSCDEIISFHHTKPWGFGEGGCVITDKQTAETIRKMINFGVNLPAPAKPFVSNGKMPETSAAFLLERLDRFANWSRLYRMQYRRIALLANQLKLDILLPSEITFSRHAPLGKRGSLAGYCATPAHVPILMPKEVATSELNKLPLTFRKYYIPLAGPETCPMAHDIYSRIVNVPCHPEMGQVEDQTILDCLQKLI